MTGDPLRATPGGDGDSWESLAQDLFGIEFSSPPAGDDLPLLDETSSIAKPKPSDEGRGADDADDEDDVVELTDDDLLDDEELSEVEETEEVAAESAESRADDPYWDALNDWHWDDAPRERSGGEKSKPHDSKRQGGSRKRDDRRSSREPSQPPSTPAPAAFRESDDFPSTSDLREEYIDDDGFGAGLWESPSTSVQKSEEAAESDSVRSDSDEPGGEREGQRRRRRRRRGRRSRSGEARTAETTESIADDDSSDSELEATESDVASDRDEHPEEQGEEAEREPGERRPRRRRRRRRRGEPRTGEPATSTSETRPVEAAEEEDEDVALLETLGGDSEDDSDEDSDSQWDPSGDATYRNIPTWEEAISYLLNPSRVESSPRETSAHSSDKGSAERSAEGKGQRHKSGSRPSGRRRRRR